MAILNMLPQAAFAPGILNMGQVAPLAPAGILSRAIPPEDQQPQGVLATPAAAPRKNFGHDYLRSQDFSMGLMRGGAALLSGKGLGGAFDSMADSMDLYRKRQASGHEMVDPSKYVEQVTDPETGELSYRINEQLQAANAADLKAKNEIKPYQAATLDLKERQQGFRESSYDRTQDERERSNVAREGLLRLGYDEKVVNHMLGMGLRYGEAGAEVPEGYSVPLSGGGGQPQAPQGRVQSYGGGIEQTARAAIPGLNVTSGYRDPAHNRKVGGTANSFHTTDDARDFTPPAGMSMAQLAAALKQRFPGYDVINERDHTHVEPGPGMAPSARRQGTPQQRMVSAPRVKVTQKPKASSVPKGYYQPKSKAEFDQLPSGTKFIAPDGSARIKP